MSTWYIAPATHPTTPGNDTTGNGSNATPWATISKAHTSATTGDTIICKDGTYTWANQTFSKSLTIQAETTGLAIFDGAGGAISWSISGAVTLTFLGLTFTDATGTRQFNSNSATGATITWQLCRFYNFGGAGGSNEGFFQLAESATNANHYFDSCAFYDLRQTSSTGLAVVNVASNQSSILLDLSNCVIYLASDAVSRIFRFAGSCTFALRNSIIQNDTGSSIDFKFSTPGTSTTDYNCWNNITSPPSGTGNITDDPLFVDAASGVFDLRPTSPCLNTGTLI